MSDDQPLRIRIATAAAAYFEESGAYFDHYADDCAVIDGNISLLDLADTVIAKLGLVDE